MKDSRTILFVSMILAAIFILPAFAMDIGSRVDEPEAVEIGPRVDHYEETLKGGYEETSITFANPGTKKAHAFELPTKSKIVSATMDITGEPYYTVAETYTDLTFSDTSDKRAWWGLNKSTPSGTHPSVLISSPELVEFSSGDYSTISVDSGYVGTDGGWYPDYDNPYHMFEFTVSKEDTGLVNITWKGTARSPTYTYPDTDAKVYVYNGASSKWDMLDLWKNPMYNNQVGTLNIECDRNYIVNNKVYVIAYGMNSYGSSEFIRTDFIRVRAFDRQANYPTNSQLDISADGSKEWTFAGVLDTTTTFSGFDFQNALQMAVLGSALDEVTIIMEWSTETKGQFVLSNINITYKVNTKPLIEIIPSPIQIEEDVGSYNTKIDIKDFITDDFGFDKLTIETNGDSEDTVEVTFNEKDQMVLTPAENFYGDVFVNISATDWGLDDIDDKGGGDDNTVYSTEFVIQVLATDDPPEITAINDVEPKGGIVKFVGSDAIKEDSTFRMNISAIDMDGDEIEYSSDSINRRFLVYKKLGIIDFKPDHRDIGKHNIVITATENNFSAIQPLSSSIELEIEVVNVNDVPRVLSFEVEGDKTYTKTNPWTEIHCEEDSPINITLNTYDEEGDPIMLDTNFTNSRFSFDSVTGKLTFTPDQTDVGINYVGFTLDDGNDGVGTATIRLVVDNVNDRPENKGFTITPGKSDDNNITVFANEGFDIDGDELIYKWNFGDKFEGVGRGAYHDYDVLTYDRIYTVTLIVSDGRMDSEPMEQDYLVKGTASPTTDDDPTTDLVDPSDEWKENGQNRIDDDSDGVYDWWEEYNAFNPKDPYDINRETKEQFNAELNIYNKWWESDEDDDLDDDDDTSSDKQSNTGSVVVVLIVGLLITLSLVAIILLMFAKKKKKKKSKGKDAKKEEKKGPKLNKDGKYVVQYGRDNKD